MVCQEGSEVVSSADSPGEIVVSAEVNGFGVDEIVEVTVSVGDIVAITLDDDARSVQTITIEGADITSITVEINGQTGTVSIDINEAVTIRIKKS